MYLDLIGKETHEINIRDIKPRKYLNHGNKLEHLEGGHSLSGKRRLMTKSLAKVMKVGMGLIKNRY